MTNDIAVLQDRLARAVVLLRAAELCADLPCYRCPLERRNGSCGEAVERATFLAEIDAEEVK